MMDTRVYVDRDVKTFAFVSYEIYPTVKGGVGSLLTDFLRNLTRQTWRVILLLDISPSEHRQFRDVDLPREDIKVEVIPLCVDELIGPPSNERASFDSEYAYKSFRFAQALKVAHAQYDIDYVEFFDYCGVGFFSLAERLVHPQLYPKIIAIHHHNTIEIIDQNTYHGLIDDRRDAYALERTAMPMADCFITHGWRFFQTEYQDRYWLDPARAIVNVPAVRRIPPPMTRPQRSDRVLFYGRQSRLKGLDIFLAGAVCFLMRNPEADVLFTIIGPSDAVTGTSVSVNELVPPDLQKYFHVVGPIERDEVSVYASEAKCAVFPNKSESFCFAMHELLRLELPIIANDIPAFRDHCEDGEVLFFDGTIDGLSSALARLLSDDGLATQLRLRTKKRLGRYIGDDWGRVISQFPRPCSGGRIETVLILSFRSDRLERRSDNQWTFVTDLGRTIVVLDIVLEQAVQSSALWLFGDSWSAPHGLIEPRTLNQSFDLIIFVRQRSSLSQCGIKRLAEIAVRNSRPDALLVVTRQGEVRSFSSQAAEAVMPSGLGAHGPEVELYALWNWRNYTFRDFEALLHHARWHGVIAALSSKRIPWVAHLPSDILGLRLRRNTGFGREQEFRSAAFEGSVRTAITVNHFGRPLQGLAEAILATKGDRGLFYVFNTSPQVGMNEVWIAGESRDSNTIVFEGERYQIFGYAVETTIEIAGCLIPVAELRSGFLRGRISGSELCGLLMHPYSGAVILVVAGEVFWESLRSDEARICKPVVELADRAKISWKSCSVRARSLSGLGPKIKEPRNYLEMLEPDGKRSIQLHDFSINAIVNVIRDQKARQRVIQLNLSATDLVTLIETEELICDMLTSRLVLRHTDFWSSSADELIALAKLTTPLYARHISGNISTSSPLLSSYLADIGIDVHLCASNREYSKTYRPGSSILVIAIPEIIGSIAHVMTAISMFLHLRKPTEILLTAGSQGQLFLDLTLCPNLSVSIIEECDAYPESLPDIGVVICLYPYPTMPPLLAVWTDTGVPIITSCAFSNLDGRASIHQIVLWEDAKAIVDKLDEIFALPEQ